MNFVRESHFRHVFGEDNSVEKSYTDLQALTAGDGSFIKVNPKFFCVAKKGGGGPVYIHNVDDYGRFALNHPTINVHTAQVLDFDFNPFCDNVVATGSDDCTIAVTKFPEAGLTENITKPDAVLNGHNKKIAFLHWHPTSAQVLGSVAYDRLVKVWDVEYAEEVLSVGAHDDNIFSFAWSNDGKLGLTTSRDSKLRVFDPRNPESDILSADTHASPKTAKGFFVEDKGLVASVGFKKSSVREILFYDMKKMGEPLHKIDLDQGNSVLWPCYEAANSMLYMAGKGDATIRYFELTDQEGFCHYLSDHRSNVSQKGVAFMPRRGVDTGRAELLKIFRLTRDAVIPCSMMCPRKNAKAVFQEDLYPDCASAEPAQNADSYFEGKDAKQCTMTLRKESAQSPTSGRRKRRLRGDSAPKEPKKADEKPVPSGGGGGDGGGDDAKVKELQAHVSELEKELADTKAELEEAKSAGDKKAGKKLKETEKKLKAANEELKDAKSIISELKQEVESAKKSGSGDSDKVKEMEKEMALTEKKLKRVQKDAKECQKLKEKLRLLEEEIEESESVIHDQSKKIKELTAQVA